MKLIKILILVLCTSLMLSLFSGCELGQKISDLINGESSAEVSTSDTATESSFYNSDAAYQSLDPETVILTVNGQDIYWQDFFYLINYYTGYVEYYNGAITDWAATMSEDQTYQEFIIDSAVDWILYSRSIDAGAATLGIELTAEDTEALQALWDEDAAAFDSEDAFIEDLASNYCSEDFYRYILRVTYLADKCFAKLYGEGGEALTDDELSDYYAEDGYMMAKHILILTETTDADGNSAALTDAEKEEIYATMENILQQLDTYDGDDFNAFFGELMNEYSQDTGGLSSFPEGYLFQSGDMVPEFENAYLELEEGAYSGIVESDFGYHIIYRLPINYNIEPYTYYSAGYDSTYTLRFMAANDMFNAVIDGWIADISVEYSENYNNIDFTEIYG